MSSFAYQLDLKFEMYQSESPNENEHIVTGHVPFGGAGSWASRCSGSRDHEVGLTPLIPYPFT